MEASRRKARALLLFLVSLSLVAFAGAAQASHHEDLGEPHVSDAKGDAMEGHSDSMVNLASGACSASWETSSQCYEVVDEGASDAPTVGGEPAHPALDILSVTLWESATALNVTLEVAELDDDWPGVYRETPLGAEPAALYVQWFNDEERGCMEWVSLALWGWDLDEGSAKGVYMNQEDHCNDGPPAPEDPWERACNYYWMCRAHTTVETESGSPGYITWSVPRDGLVGGDADETLYDVGAYTMRFPSSDVQGYIGWTVGAQDLHTGGWTGTSGYTVDDTDAGAPFTFTTAREPWPSPQPGEPHATGEPHEEPLLHLSTLDVEETPETLRFVATLEQVDEVLAERSGHWLAVGLPTGHVLDISVFGSEDGEYEAFGVYWEPGPDEPLQRQGHFVIVPVELEVAPGAPGTVALTIERDQISPIEAGSLTNLLQWLVREDYNWNEGAGVDEAETSGRVYSPYVRAGSSSGTGFAPLYRFIHDTPTQALDAFVRASDATGDTNAPDPAFEESLEARFDITYIEARAIDEETTHLTIGVNDLSRASVPRGYDGMFYALAAQQGDRTTMVGYHKAAGASAGDFLCAPDITVLTETQRDPTEAVWTLIEGVVSAPPGGGSGQGGPGAITFHVPNACFGDEAMDASEDDTVFDRFAAGTYLVRSSPGGLTQGTVYEVDAAEAEGQVSLSIPDDAEIEPASWYAAPLGVESFWDMLGLAIALAVATGGAAVKIRSRRISNQAIREAKAKDHREIYREALERAIDADPHDDVASDKVLVSLRERFSISEREHALMELDARAAAGLDPHGLTEGGLFLGKYRILEQAGEGGFARAFLAHDEKLDRNVILKVAHCTSPKESRRALKEGRVLARLDDPRIVTVHDVEHVGNELILILEHVPQGSLKDRLSEEPLAPADALAITKDVLLALEAAHEAGIVHRDIKPDNILIDDDGRAKLVDFGIAQAPDLGKTVTNGLATNEAAGTLSYMAPERTRGTEAGPESDLYSLGAVLYETLAGERYLDFQGLSLLEAREAIQEDAPLLPLAGVPASVNDLLKRALAKDPGDRPQSAGEMLDLLKLGPGIA